MRAAAQPSAVLALAGLGALALATAVARTPLGEPLWVSCYRDDAYYCFAWARSVADGVGPAVGAGVPTSGVHVGWELLLLPLAVCGDAVLEAGARWLGLAVLALAGAVVARALRRDGVEPAAALGGALALLAAPAAWLEAQNGQETALGCLALAWLLHERRAPGWRFALGCLVATAARSDVWLFAAALAWLAREGRPWRRLAPPLVALVAYGLWNTALAGSPVQDSAAPMAWLFRERLLATDPGVAELGRALWWWGRPVLLAGPFAEWAPVGIAALCALAWRPGAVALRATLPVALAVAAALGVDDLLVPALVAALWLAPPPAAAAARQPARALLLGCVGLAALHYVLRLYPRDYYFAPFAVAGAYGLGHALRGGGPRAVALVVAVAIATGIQLSRPPRQFVWQQAMDLAGRHLDRFTGDPTAVVGSFNSGLVTWRRPGPVLNLDGVVDRPAFAALRRRQLGAWLAERGVRWLCDNPVQFDLDATLPHACGRYFGAGFDPARDLTPVARFVVPGFAGERPGTAAFVLYRLGAAAGPGEVTTVAPAPARPPGSAVFQVGGERTIIDPPR
ncbi:MAG: hypothetical protein IPM29_12095 [Planctomycetes bacterium]|nr:hypothetical protein [Planctomycetota bacterium]